MREWGSTFTGACSGVNLQYQVLYASGLGCSATVLDVRGATLQAKRFSRPGAFELLGGFDADVPEAVLFEDDVYRGLMNLLVFRSES